MVLASLKLTVILLLQLPECLAVKSVFLMFAFILPDVLLFYIIEDLNFLRHRQNQIKPAFLPLWLSSAPTWRVLTLLPGVKR